MAVKKSTTKRVVKKASKKAPAKRKAVAKKSVAKKSTAKKRVAKKAVAKKRVAKKSAVKKTAKRTTKKVAKKSSAKKSSASTFVVPPVPRGGISTSSRVNVSTTPVAAKSTSTSTPKPSVAPKQGTSKTVLGAVVVGVILLAIIVWSQSGSGDDDGAMPTPPATAEATPEATTEPTAEATPTEEVAPVAAVEAPSKFVALNSAEGLTLRWIAPTATDGLTGYNVEIRANGKGDWNVIATVPADQLTQSVTKSDTSGWTQFRVTSVYADGQSASATVFGIPGVFA